MYLARVLFYFFVVACYCPANINSLSIAVDFAANFIQTQLKMKTVESLTVVQIKKELKTLGAKPLGNRVELVKMLQDLRNGVSPTKQPSTEENKTRRRDVSKYFDEEAQESNGSDIEEYSEDDDTIVSSI